MNLISQALPHGRSISRAGRWWERLRLRRGLRLQLTAWYGAALLVFLVLLGLFVYWLLSTNLRRDAADQLQARASQLASSFTTDQGGINFQDTAGPGELILVYSDKGVLTESAGSGQPGGAYSPSALPSWAKSGSTQSTGTFSTSTISGTRWLMYAMPLSQGEQPGGTGWLIVGRSLEPMYGLLGGTLSALALAGPLVILLACLGGYFLAGRALAPVMAITRAARKVQAEGLGSGHVSRIGIAGRRDELGELASTFDAMLERLEDSFGRERRFTADAAHELRTPLAVVQAETSLALARSRRVDEYKRVLGVVEGEAARMGKLVADLLALARSDEGQHQLERAPVDMSSLCRTVLRRLSTPAAEKGVSLSADIPEGIGVAGDSAWLAQMLLNLVDNGIKYTQAGGWVKLQLAQSLGSVDVIVEDSGIGISSEQLPHIFDRFYRADSSRARDSESGGLGLGLAICEWIATTHGGSIEVSSEVGHGSRFVVRLPRAVFSDADSAG